MAQLINVKLSRFDSSPWGFRLQGGKDFGQPLVIQKVNGNSIAEKAGLQAGDALIRVNNVELFNLPHKDAQNALVRAGNSFELTIQRGGSTWKPSVTPIGPTPNIQQSGNVQPVTKTSLAYNKPAAPHANQYNFAPKPFGASHVNGETIKSIANKQYNTPVALYSEETIAETLSAQAEVLAGGVLGVNFKKNEKTYNAANSEVLKMVQEIDNEPREPEPDVITPQIPTPTTPKASNVPVSNPLSGLRHVSAPETKPPQPAQDPFKVLPPGQNICADCERLIVGLFVRIKDKNLHVECFKCATCGTSLKNVGYYNINNKLYCDVHAKMVARQNPPAPNLEPITVPPGSKVPSSVIASSIAAAPVPFQSQFSTPSSAPAPGSPQPGTLAPLPFHAPHLGIRHVNAPRSYMYPYKTSGSNVQPSKPTISQPPVQSPLARPQSGIFGGFKPSQSFRDSVQEGNIQYQSYSTLTQSAYETKQENVSFEQKFEQKSEFKSKETRQASSQKKLSICSQEIGKMHMDAQNMVKHLTEILEDRCPSPTPSDEARKLAALESSSNNETNRINEETIHKVEQEQQWAKHQSENTEIINQHLKIKGTGEAFLRSHSTPVSELEALYEQQQKEIEAQKEKLKSLGSEKELIADEVRKKEIEFQIIESQKQIIESQEKQKEIERKKHVRFEEAEHKRRESLQIQQLELEQKRREFESQQIEQEQRRRYEEAQKRHQEQNLLSVESLRERARTPVAELEAYERDDEMSPKTQKIFHTYENLIQPEIDELQSEIAAKPEVVKTVPRPVTPARVGSPFPGSIPLAEKSLLLKNIQGIEFEFEQAHPKKPEPKKFKLPDLRNLGKVKPLSFVAPPAETKIEAQVQEVVQKQEIKPEPILIPEPILKPESILKFEPPKPEVLPPEPTPEVILRPEIKPELVQQQPQPLPTFQTAEFNAVDQKKYQIQQQIQQERLQHQQIKEQRKQVHEELALNEKFRKKQETLGIQRTERAKTPVAELEEVDRNWQQSERTKQIYSSYDQVIQSEELKSETILEAEKLLLFQNMQGINLGGSAPEPKRIELPVKAPQPNVQDTKTLKTQKSYEEYKAEQERLFQQQKLEQQKYCEQQKLLQQQQKTSLASALTIAPERPYSPLPAPSAILPQKVPLPDQTRPYIPKEQTEALSLVDALTIAPEKPFSAQVFEAGSIDSAILNTEQRTAAFGQQQQSERRASLGFPGINVQRTPYQMFKGSQIKTAFEEELKAQESAISQFLTKEVWSEFQSYSSESSSIQQTAIAPAVAAAPTQVAYAPAPHVEKKAEVIASQSKLGVSSILKQEKPKPTPSAPKPSGQPMTMAEALTIAPERPYSPFPDVQKPQATLVCGGAAVALMKDVEVKPIYQVKDTQFSKDKIGTSGISEEKREKQAEGGVIKGAGLVGTYQKSQEKYESVQQYSTEKPVQKIEIPPLPLPPIIEQETPKEALEFKSFPPVTQQLKSQGEYAQKSIISQKSSVAQSSAQQVSQKVTRSEDSSKVVERRVTEVIECESSRKEFSQVRVIGGNIDPNSGLRRVGSEGFANLKQAQATGLQKPATIPTYQSLITDHRVESRPKSLPGLKTSKSSDKIPEKVPLAYRSRTPVPLPTIAFEPSKPTYNQTEVYRSCSPRPIPVPKQQGTYFGQQPAKQTLKPIQQTAYRSTSPVPVPKLLSSTERYQQPVTRRQVQVKEQQPRVSWPPQSGDQLPTSQYTPKPLGEIQQKSKDGKKVQWPPKEPAYELQETAPEPFQTQKVVKAQISAQQQQQKQPQQQPKQQQQQPKQQQPPQKLDMSKVPKVTNLQGKGIPGPKPDPIVAPRPFGTPTPQRKIATPHFQPIKPVAITQGQPAAITAPKLTFSSTQDTKVVTKQTLERKISLSNSTESAFRPVDTSPVKPTPFKPISTFINANIDTNTLPSMNTLLNNVPPTNIPDINQSIVDIQKTTQKTDPIGKEPQNKQGSVVDKSGNSGAGAGGAKGATFAGATTPRRGKGVLNPPNALRIPLCASCNGQIRGPFITALGKIWCPDHFICSVPQCRRPLADIGFVEEEGKGLFCEFCFEKYIAPSCDKCTKKVKGDCLNAIGKHFHPECFNCAYCGKLFGNSPFFLEDGLPYCEADWNELFTTKCFACGFPIEAGDRWVEALNNNYHSQCFNCTSCKTNLEGQSFYAKGGRPFCKAHAR